MEPADPSKEQERPAHEPASQLPTAQPPASINAPYTPDDTLVYAGFWWRSLAFQIDFILVIVLSALVFSGFRSVASGVVEAYPRAFGAVSFLLMTTWLFYAGFEASRLQATPGKWLLGLRVTNREGTRIGFVRASARHVFRVVGATPFMGGLVLAAFTKKKQALHDWISDSLCLRRRGSLRLLRLLARRRPALAARLSAHSTKIVAIFSVLCIIALTQSMVAIVAPSLQAVDAQ